MENQPLVNHGVDENLEIDFALDDVKHEIAAKYKPKFLAKGGEQIVYEIPDHPDVVAKVNVESLKAVIDWNIHHGETPDSFSEEIRERAEKILDNEVRRYVELKQHFGSEHIPTQKQYLIQIPVTPEILNRLYDNKPPIITDAVWSITTIQKRVEELNDSTRLALVSGYAEKTERPSDEYHHVTEHLVFGKNPEEKLTLNQFLEIQGNDNLRGLMKKSESDMHLRDVLCELIEKIISYTEKTAEILDIAGDDNIIFFQKDNKWSYMLVDAKYPGNDDIMNGLKLNLDKLTYEIEVEEFGENILLNAFNYIRTINGIAEQLGIKARIFVGSDITGLELDFQAILGKNIQKTTGAEDGKLNKQI
jgi:hypothetical protein